MSAADEPPSPGDVYFEFTVIGRNLKVSAIDAATGTEVSIVGPVSASRQDLQRVALKKLMVRLKSLA